MKSLLKKLIPEDLHPLRYVNDRVLAHFNGIIPKGPFKGMHYIDEAYTSFLCPKITGTYEKEIQPVMELEKGISYDAFIDIGAAEGYYSVGMALFSESKSIISFEASEYANKLQLELAKLNKVEDKIVMLGFCESSDLTVQTEKYEKIFILCDVDGYELALLDNQATPRLNFATMLIECHNHCYAEMEISLKERFKDTHDSTSFTVRTKADLSDYPCPSLYYNILPRKYKDFPIRETERAQEDTWLYLKPKRYQ